MRDYWLTQDLLKAAGLGFIALCLLGIGLALWLPKKWWHKGMALVVVVFLISIPVRQANKEVAQQQVAADDYKERYAKAKALFDERCKTAGEKIYRTVESVEGVLLINPRPRASHTDWANRDWIGAGFPGESGGKHYIMEFLYYNKPQTGNYARQLGWVRGGLRGYLYVDIAEQGKHVRYRLRDVSEYVNSSDPVDAYGKQELHSGSLPRYAIGYENIEDPLGRASWIAGGRVVVVDRKDKDVLGEFIRYAFEPGFGSTTGARSPWAFSVQCPLTNYGGASGHIRSFVERVVKPKQGD